MGKSLYMCKALKFMNIHFDSRRDDGLYSVMPCWVDNRHKQFKRQYLKTLKYD